MANCPNCAEPLPQESPACPNCGQLVASERRISGGEGVALGCFTIIAALFVWLAVGALVNSQFIAKSKCADELALRLYDGSTIVLCLAALVAGIRAARRGAGGLAIFLIMPAVALLLPATACAVTVFSSC